MNAPDVTPTPTAEHAHPSRQEPNVHHRRDQRVKPEPEPEPERERDAQVVDLLAGQTAAPALPTTDSAVLMNCAQYTRAAATEAGSDCAESRGGPRKGGAAHPMACRSSAVMMTRA